MNLRLRTISSRDEAQGVQALLEQAVRESGALLGERKPVDVARRYVEHVLGTREALLVVAEPREVARPLALAASAPLAEPLTGEQHALLVLLYVDPSIRQRGVARSLVQELRRSLAARGIPELWARAATNDDALISMGERWGFARQWELMSAE
jgi:ribosomal protein S18 acetylase RimI-like enzyme